jgi:hypothetical protein
MPESKRRRGRCHASSAVSGPTGANAHPKDPIAASVRRGRSIPITVPRRAISRSCCRESQFPSTRV